MSLRPQPLPSVPSGTARVARAAFRRGNPYLLLRDRLGAVFEDADFADLYPRLGQPAYAPWRLALVTLMQFREGLSDRQAADAVRGRIDWKYLLALDLEDAGFDFSVLCEFRARLLGHAAAGRLLDRLLGAAREGGLLKARGRSRDLQHPCARRRARAQPPGASGRDAARGAERGRRRRPRLAARRRAARMARALRPTHRGHAPGSAARPSARPTPLGWARTASTCLMP